MGTWIKPDVEVLAEAAKETPEEKLARHRRRMVRIPASWGKIPWRASREEEVEWVHQNYVLVVKTVKGVNKFYLSYALSPAPSYGAIRLMRRAAMKPETWDREVFFKMKSEGGEEGKDRVRQEKRSIEEVERVLGKLLEVPE